MAELSDLSFVTKKPKSKVVVVPALLSQEALRDAFLPEYNRVVAEEYGNNATLRNLDSQGRGSNPFVVGLAKRITAPFGVRPVILADDRDGRISSMIRGRFYVDFADLVVHSPKHTYGKNERLLKDVIGQVESKVGSVKFPFKVTGLVPEVWEEDSENGYGLRFVPSEDFDYVSDDRLNLQSGARFNVVDEKGVIVPNENGSRTWYLKENGLSRSFLLRDLNLLSNDGYLACSVDVKLGLSSVKVW